MTSTTAAGASSSVTTPPRSPEARPAIPLRDGTPAQFAQVREYLGAVGFTGEGICRRFGIASIYEFRTVADGRVDEKPPADALEVLSRLFMDSLEVDAATVRAHVDAAVVETMRQLGLLTAAGGDDVVRPTVLLYPTESLYIVSDAPTIAASNEEAPKDLVYPAITRNTGGFLAMVPRSPCDSFLELCAGTGIAALVASRTAARAWAVDITERSTRFAEFNARLNGIENCAALCGDLYEPVRGQTFDRIAAHPPYMPSFQQQYIFRDGGEDGEQISRRIIAGLPAYLRPGGELYCTCMGTDRVGEPFEQRVRAMLGERNGEFDVTVVTHGVYDFGQYYLKRALEGKLPFSELEARAELFKQLRVEHMVYCTIIISRHDGERAPVTTRRTGFLTTRGADAEWLIRWERTVADAGDPRWLLERRPRGSPAAELRVAHRQADGEWLPAAGGISTQTPFYMEARVPLWTMTLFMRADGRRTVRELHQLLHDGGALSPDITAEALAGLIETMIGAGFLLIDGYEPPALRAPEPAHAQAGQAN